MMKDDTLYFENKPPHAFRMNHRKGAVAACALVLVTTYVLYVVLAVWWTQPFFYQALPVLFLLAGCCYVYLLKKNLPGLALAERWGFSIVLGAALLLLLALSFLWNQQLSWRTVFTAAGAFLLPFTWRELWLVYAEISFSDIRPWQVTEVSSDELPTTFLHGLRVRFRVIQEPDISGAGSIPVMASGRMKLSDVFYKVVQKQNQQGQYPIALKSRELENYTWVFYKTDMFLWYRSLDPEKTLLDNNIGKNALIFAQRVSTKAFAAAMEKDKKLMKQ